MNSFFNLAESISSKLYSEEYGSDEYDSDEYEDDDDYFQEEKTKSFEQIFKEIKNADEWLWQPYVLALENLLQSDKDFDVNEKNFDSNKTILMIIACTGRLDLVKALLARGVDINAICKDYKTALQYSAENGWQEIFDYLAPLTNLEFRRRAKQELADGLLRRKMKEDDAYIAIETLGHAALFGNIDAVKTAISLGTNLNSFTENGETALHKAIRNEQLDIVHLLLDSGADPNLKNKDNGESPTMVALRQGSRLINKLIVDELFTFEVDLNARNNLGWTLLMAAIESENIKVIKNLLNKKVEINAQDNYGYTSLSIAKAIENSEIIRLLLEAGAEEN